MVKVTALADNGNATVEIGPIDPDLLSEQSNILSDLIINDGDNPLWGIVAMLNDVVDAIDLG